MGLMYNPKDDKLVTRSELALVETPEALGRFHRPISYSDYVDMVTDSLVSNGLKVSSEEYAITKDGGRMFGMMEVSALEGELITADDWKLTVGLRGSHDQKIGRGIALGSQVMVCSNLCFHGDVGTFKTKQTINALQRLPNMINAAVQRIPELAHQQERVFDRYKNQEFKPRWGDAAMVELYRRDALTSAQLGKAVDEWHNPSFIEHGEHGNSVWKAFNAATEAVKPTGHNPNMELVRQRTENISQFFNDVVGL